MIIGQLFIIALLGIVICLCLFHFCFKYNIGLISKSNSGRKIHSKELIQIGGLIFLSLIYSLFIIEKEILKFLLLFSFIFLFLGLASDLYENFSSLIRLLLMSIFVFYFIINYNLIINNIDLYFSTTNFLENYYAALIFTALCILVSINGFNFIDGNHGLLLGTTIIITLNFFLIINSTASSDLNFMLLSIISISFVLFIVNIYSGKIITGDTGAYFIGFYLGALAVYIKSEQLMNAFHIACILFYPAMEVIISFLRRIAILGRNPFYPDNLHLHSIVYQILVKKNKKIKKNSSEFLNKKCSLLILSFQLFFSVLIYFFGGLVGYANSLSILSIIYIVSYFILLQRNSHLTN